MKPKRTLADTSSGAATAPARAKKTATHASRAAASEPEVSVTATEPSYEEIAALAYSFWEARGYAGGSEEEDWHRAEQELRARR
jgi:hypothetical protein